LHEERRKIEEEKRKIQREENRKSFEYWSSINPYEFESKIAILFQKNGFFASATKGSGDGGVDIELEIRSKKGAVQCKRQKTKVSPGVVRDLYGTMIAGGYDFGFVVCPAGFSDQTFEFVKGKKIRLIGLKRIVEMANQDSQIDFLGF
jgi:HJR/Mrr/RecB family endonuclease